MNKQFAIIVAVFFILALPGCQSLLEKYRQEGAVQLTGNEIINMIAGKTFKTNDYKDSSKIEMFTEDGKLLELYQDGKVKREGTWRINDNGNLCKKFSNWPNEKCPDIYANGDEFRMFSGTTWKNTYVLIK